MSAATPHDPWDALWDLIDDRLPESDLIKLGDADVFVEAIREAGWRPPAQVVNAVEALDALIVEGREKLAAATNGEWFAWDRGVGYMIALDPDGDRVLPEGGRTDLGRREDAELIAWMRNNLEALLDAAEKVAELEAQIDRVRKVHQPVEAVNYGHRRPQLANVCSGCGTDAGNWQVYPCPTIRALTQEAR